MQTDAGGKTAGPFPKTGRIGRFVKILETETDGEAFKVILKNADRYASYNAEEKSAWWNDAVEALETKLGRDKAIGVMHQCGAKCCGKGQRRTAKRLFDESQSLRDFLDRIGKHDVKEGELRYTLEGEHTIVAEHCRCFCRQAAHAKIPFGSLTYCRCSEEFSRQFFSAALGKDVRVEILQSIVCGADSCKFRITF